MRPRYAAAPLLVMLCAVALVGCSQEAEPSASASSASATTIPSDTTAPSTPAPSPGDSTTTAASSGPSGPVPDRTSTIATDLDVPWAIAFLPDGSALVTLRDQARLLRVREGAAPVDLGEVPGVQPNGEGGLLGVAVSPDFASDGRIFLYTTANQDNRVVTATLRNGRLGAPEPILTGIPRAGNHNGGRLKFGPDGFLYVTTGDAGDTSRSQDRGSLGGKILRITPEGDPAPGNPFAGSPVYSLGHRNVQGIAWDADGRMFASEFGQNTWDELNAVTPGANYGWPEFEGDEGGAGITRPLRQWATSDASPSGIAVDRDGDLYMAALRGESLWRVPLSGGRTGEPERLLQGQYGRLRDVVLAPDGRLWVLTNNTSRGSGRDGDDRLLAVPPARLTR